MDKLKNKLRLQQIKICQLKKANIDAITKHKEVIFSLYELILRSCSDEVIEDIIENIKNELKKVNM